MRILFWVLASVVGVAVVAGVGWVYSASLRAQNMASGSRARAQGRPIPVRTALVTQSQVEEIIGATAITEASQVATIRVGASRLSPSREFRATAVSIKAVHVVEGDRVEKGQLLFELDESPLAYVAAQREAEFSAATAELALTKQTTALNQTIRGLELASAESNLAFRREDLDTSQKEFESQEQLLAKSSTSYLNFLEAKTKYSRARFDLTEAEHTLQRAKDSLAVGALRDKLEVELAEAKYQTASVALEMAKSDLKECRITSPIDGFMGAVTVLPGEVVDSAAEFARVLKLDPIYVRMDYPQERLDELEIGQKADVVLDSFLKDTFQGTVRRSSPQVTPQLRVLPVVIELANPRNRIKAGISGFVRLRLNKNATTVPATAVIQQGRKAMLFCVTDGRARIREIQTGPVVDTGWIEVRGDLVPGQEVVIYGNEHLRDDDAVDVNWRKWARRE